MDFYGLLGVDRTATLAEIKRAYRRLARKYHPDINPGDRAAERLFRRIVEAYETLSDPVRRREYDVRGHRAVAREPAAPEFAGFDFSAEADRAARVEELFADLWNRARRAEAPVDGSDLHATVALSFDEALSGTQRTVTVTRLASCRTCGASGRVAASEERCPHCRGQGVVRSSHGHMVFSRACPSCGGSGEQRHRLCRACGGQGVVPRTESVTVALPAGVADGMRVRVAGKGHAGQRGGRTGDLYLTVEVAPHPLFRREGDDLHLMVPVAVHEAALGAKIEIPTPQGPARLRVPPGTQSGQRFRLRGRGAPSPRTGQRGDLVAEIRLVLPPLLDERSKELLREFGRLNPGNVRQDWGR
jgi:molecular chaperone DnaJ